MLDASDSLKGEENFKLCIEFIKTVFHAFGMGGGIRFALVVFGSSAQVVFDFSKYSSISDLDVALGQVSKIDLKNLGSSVCSLTHTPLKLSPHLRDTTCTVGLSASLPYGWN